MGTKKYPSFTKSQTCGSLKKDPFLCEIRNVGAAPLYSSVPPPGLHAGQVEIVAIVMPLIFSQSPLIVILCGYVTNIFEIREHLKLCIVVLL